MANFNAFVEKSPRTGNLAVRYRDGRTKLANGRWKVFTETTVGKDQRVLTEGKWKPASWIADQIAKKLQLNHLNNQMGNADSSLLVEEEIDRYVEDCTSRNLEERTVDVYRAELRQWWDTGKFKTLSDITYRELIGWRNKLEGNSTTIRWKMTVIKSFIYWLKETEKIQVLPFKKKMAPKNKRPSPKYYTLEQWLRLRKVLSDICPITELACCIAYSAGLRRIELAGNGRGRLGILYEDLNWNADGTVDLDLRKEIVKGREQGRSIRLEPGVVALLGSRKSGPIIPLSPYKLWYNFDKARHLAGLGDEKPPLTIHGLRHSFAKNYLKYGRMDLGALQEALGHAQIATTQIYSQHEKSELDRGIEQTYENRSRDESLVAGQIAGQNSDNPIEILKQPKAVMHRDAQTTATNNAQ